MTLLLPSILQTWGKCSLLVQAARASTLRHCGLNCAPQKMSWSPNCQYLWANLFRNRVFADAIKLRWGTSVPIIRDIHREGYVTVEWWVHRQGTPGFPATLEAWERQGTDSPLQPQREQALLSPYFRLVHSRTMREFLLCWVTQFVAFVTAALRN
jgi:hypothetical protein